MASHADRAQQILNVERIHLVYPPPPPPRRKRAWGAYTTQRGPWGMGTARGPSLLHIPLCLQPTCTNAPTHVQAAPRGPSRSGGRQQAAVRQGTAGRKRTSNSSDNSSKTEFGDVRMSGGGGGAQTTSPVGDKRLSYPETSPTARCKLLFDLGVSVRLVCTHPSTRGCRNEKKKNSECPIRPTMAAGG